MQVCGPGCSGMRRLSTFLDRSVKPEKLTRRSWARALIPLFNCLSKLFDFSSFELLSLLVMHKEKLSFFFFSFVFDLVGCVVTLCTIFFD